MPKKPAIATPAEEPPAPVVPVELGLDRGYSAHSIRATLITTALENGAHLEDVQKAAGHTATRARQSCIIGGATIRAINDSPTFRERDMAERVRDASPRVDAAFAAVAREDFLGPGPWQIVRWGGGYRATPDPDPVYLYTDDVIGILPERNLNNGQPSLHAALIAAAAPQPGEHVVHVGAGVGYYTAILAELVGAMGRVTAIEFDAELAARATANFAQTPHARVVHGDGARVLFEPADVIRATRLADIWLDRLKEGRRLILL
jgi:protein-L-isoaspartate O-methyltransferase